MRSANERADIRRRFRVLRASVDLNQRDAACAAKMTLSRYTLIENGLEIPDEAEESNLAKAFEISVETFRLRTGLVPSPSIDVAAAQLEQERRRA